MGSPIRPRTAQLHQDPSIIGELESVLRERRPEEISAQFLYTRAVMRSQGNVTVQVEVRGRQFWARGCCVSTVGLDEAEVCEYIRNQEQEDQRQEELGL